MKKNIRKIKKQIKAQSLVEKLSQPDILVDNELDLAFRSLQFKKILSNVRFRKRSGDDLLQVMFALLLYPLLSVNSISAFCGKGLNVYIRGGRSVLYDFMKRIDLRWRSLRLSTAKAIYRKSGLADIKEMAFVFDDTLKHRRGKKVEGASWHFDHTTKKSEWSQQSLEMGLASAKGYLPIDTQLCIGKSKPALRDEKKPFADNRALVAVDYKDAKNKDKNQLLREMLKRVLRKGIRALYVIADSWYGNKGNIHEVIRQGLIGIFRMKDNEMKYRVAGRLLSAKTIYLIKKKKAKKIKGFPWKLLSIEAEIDLSEESAKKSDWRKVALVFSIPRDEHRGNFAIFLCTDATVPAKKVIQMYSLRWSIEVYFKEVKQHMGFLTGQTGNYVCHYASVHLAALRYMQFSYLSLTDGGGSFSNLRSSISEKLQLVSYAVLLWDLFKALLDGALGGLVETLGSDSIDKIKVAIEEAVNDFFSRAFGTIHAAKAG